MMAIRKPFLGRTAVLYALRWMDRSFVPAFGVAFNGCKEFVVKLL